MKVLSRGENTRRNQTDPLKLSRQDWLDLLGDEQFAEHLEGVLDINDATGESDAIDRLIDKFYAVKFQFVNCCPGYVGELYILQPDSLEDVPPWVFTRNRDGKLEMTDFKPRGR